MSIVLAGALTGCGAANTRCNVEPNWIDFGVPSTLVAAYRFKTA